MVTKESEDHICTFPQVEILEDDEDDVLKKGMNVLIPCSTCGETPLDHLNFMEERSKELNDALISVEPHRPLYHWAPKSRQKQIIRYGLRPGMRRTTSEGYRAPCVCFADSPSWAWALSGQMRRASERSWDLWQTFMDRLTSPLVLGTSERPSGLYEVRTEHRIYKRDLWYVGSREK
jgi:hypothetical protein